MMKVSGWPAAVDVFVAKRLKNLRIDRVTRAEQFGAFQSFRSSTLRVFDLEAVTKTLGGKFARGIARQTQGERDRWTQQRIAGRVQHQRQRTLGAVMLLVADTELGDQALDRVSDGVKRIAVAG